MNDYIFNVDSDLWHTFKVKIHTSSKEMAFWIMEHRYNKNQFEFIG